MGASAATAVIVIKEKAIVAAFRDARAVSPDTAQTAAAIGVHERIAFHMLRARAVIREVEPGRYYLDEPSWEALRHIRRRRVLILGLLIVVAAAWVLQWK